MKTDDLPEQAKFYWCCDINAGFLLEHFFPMMCKMNLDENTHMLHYLHEKHDGDKGFRLAKHEALSQFEWSINLIKHCEMKHHETRTERVDKILDNIDDND
jgi:hypothetical protein